MGDGLNKTRWMIPEWWYFGLFSGLQVHAHQHTQVHPSPHTKERVCWALGFEHSQALDPSITFYELQRREEHMRLWHREVVIQMLTVGNGSKSAQDVTYRVKLKGTKCKCLKMFKQWDVFKNWSHHLYCVVSGLTSFVEWSIEGFMCS